jgi:DNA-binding LacI/PurR family transcriptional regulator
VVVTSAQDRAPRRGRRPRLADVAAEAGVSAATVSLVLRDEPGPSAETRNRVLEAATALGYRPDRTASSLARRRSGLLGVLLDVRNPFHAELVEDLDVAAQEAGYDVVLSTLSRVRDESRAVETLLDFRCEALVLLGPEAAADALAGLDATLPTVVVGRRLRPLVADVVRTADGRGVGQTVEHLVDLGHTDVVYVDGGTGTIAADRRRGYRSAMRRRGLDSRTRVLPGDTTETAGIRAAGVVLAGTDRPTAVVTFNDRTAVGLLDGLTRAGVRVPDEVSVVGYDDSPQSRWAHVELTTVSQEAALQAQEAVRLAVERLEGRQEPHEVLLEPQLVVRSTTAPPPA